MFKLIGAYGRSLILSPWPGREKYQIKSATSKRIKVFVMILGISVNFFCLIAIGAGDEFAGTYDFVIVGAGTAGSVLANRLSEVYDWKILLLEAGGEEGFLSDIPLIAPILQITDYNWGYKTEVGKTYCKSMAEGRCNWPRGKGLGGCSTVNFMIYTRGARQDFDEWARLGNPGWSYREVLPYFLKSENSK